MFSRPRALGTWTIHSNYMQLQYQHTDRKKSVYRTSFIPDRSMLEDVNTLSKAATRGQIKIVLPLLHLFASQMGLNKEQTSNETNFSFVSFLFLVVSCSFRFPSFSLFRLSNEKNWIIQLFSLL